MKRKNKTRKNRIMRGGNVLNTIGLSFGQAIKASKDALREATSNSSNAIRNAANTYKSGVRSKLRNHINNIEGTLTRKMRGLSDKLSRNLNKLKYKLHSSTTPNSIIQSPIVKNSNTNNNSINYAKI